MSHQRDRLYLGLVIAVIIALVKFVMWVVKFFQSCPQIAM
jgi:flagellar biogenesis protein FliO